MILEVCDILFVYQTEKENLYQKIAHYIIKKVTKSRFYHVCYYYRDDIVFEIDGFKEAGFEQLERYKYKVKRLIFPKETRQRIMRRIISTEHSKYAWLEIISLFLRKALGINIFYSSKFKYICSSELVAAVYAETGIRIVPNQTTDDVSPQDLWESPYLVEVRMKE
jgi:hypothetical protein